MVRELFSYINNFFRSRKKKNDGQENLRLSMSITTIYSLTNTNTCHATSFPPHFKIQIINRLLAEYQTFACSIYTIALHKECS